MTRLLALLALAAGAAVAWLSGRSRGWNDWTDALIDDPTLARMYCDHERADEMDGVQPADPWVRGLHEGSVIPIAHFDSVTAWARGRANDLTYEQALTQAAIRSTQRDDVTTEGTS